MKKTPTLKDLWEWYYECLDHFFGCTLESCELWSSFAAFLKKKNINPPDGC